MLITCPYCGKKVEATLNELTGEVKAICSNCGTVTVLRPLGNNWRVWQENIK
jgi:uncharacterized Zn finger protein